MTVQAVVLNKLCVAAASDSRMTLCGPGGYQRTFGGSEKILALPSPHKVVILHSGRTDLLGVPYLLILDEWATTLPGRPLPTVQDYRCHLEAWIGAQAPLFTSDAQERFLGWMLRDYFLSLRTEILHRCESQGIDEEAWESDAAAAVIEDAFTASLVHLRNQPKLPGWDETDTEAVLEAHRGVVDDAREWVFDDTPRSDEGDAGLRTVAAALLGVYEPFSSDAALLFTGFGEDDLFPAAELSTVQGIIGGRLRTAPAESTTVSTDMDSSIIPLGQTEAVDTFLRAYNGDFLTRAHDVLAHFVSGTQELIGTGPALSTQLDGLGTRTHRRLDSDFDELSSTGFTRPLLRTLAALPPAEIARVAESLVGLQVLRQLTTGDVDTVGGPLDVALVTRRDGIRWVRRQDGATESGRPLLRDCG